MDLNNVTQILLLIIYLTADVVPGRAAAQGTMWGSVQEEDSGDRFWVQPEVLFQVGGGPDSAESPAASPAALSCPSWLIFKLTCSIRTI